MTDTAPTPATVPELRRITTRYVAHEDRICLTGETQPGQTRQLWLTQRLLNRLVPHLLRWLEQHPPPASHDTPQAAAPNEATAQRQTALQRFAQQSATTRLTPQEPVQVADTEVGELVQSVDVASHPQGVRLAFRPASQPDRATLRLTLRAEPMRQWLAILHVQYRRAEWPMGVWPSWFAQPEASASRVVH